MLVLTKLRNKKRYFIVVAAFILAGLIVSLVSRVNNSDPDLLSEVSINSPGIIQAHKLIDHNNIELTQDRFTGQWSFVFFGFTNCPDVCPATLMQLTQVKKAIEKDPRLKIKPVYFFVSVDPERDGYEHLADYIRYFDSSFVGLTGNISDITRFEKQFDAYHRYDKKNSSGFYTVQHSSEVFLINPDGKLIAKFAPPMDISLVLNQMNIIVSQYNNAAV